MSITYLALLRGINVGGNNIIPMAELRACFADLGATEAATYIQSGNVLFDGGADDATTWTERIERGLSERFGYEARVVLRTHDELRAVVDRAPNGFGGEPDRFGYDVIFLKEPLGAAEAMRLIEAKEGVDDIVAGEGVLYFSRLMARATESRLTRIVGRPVYKRVTIRNWRTTTRLLAMLDERST
jgi:uncharacterized protein (DUF1697 family)